MESMIGSDIVNSSFGMGMTPILFSFLVESDMIFLLCIDNLSDIITLNMYIAIREMPEV